jgi:phenylacetate-CoA ligase
MINSWSSVLFEFVRLGKEQWLSSEQLEELQWKRLKEILKHAYENTEFYRREFKDAGITPEDIKERKDLETIPITKREDIRDPERLIATGFERDKMNSSTTSGSTGRRTTTYFDRRAWLMGKLLLKLRARISCGLKPLDRLAVFTEAKTNNSLFKEFFLRQKFFSIFDPVEKSFREIETYNPTAMYGFPSYFSLLASGNAKRINSSRIFTSSEMLDPQTRKKIEGAFGAEVFDVYGCTEVKEVAWECNKHNGYHINSDWLLVEFVKNDAMGEQASIVVTSLYNYGMPLIRYEVGDTGKLLQGECPCGRGLPLMSPALGRSVDYFDLPDNSMVSPYAMTCAIENVEGMKKYQIVQEQKDLVVVNLVPNNRFSIESEHNIKASLERVLPGVTIEINSVEEIAREKNGKYRIVISKLKNTSPSP